MSSTDHSNSTQGFEPAMGSRWRWVFVGFAAIAAYFLITEHSAHIALALPYLPYLLLLACPLMHVFMHHGHHHGHAPGRPAAHRVDGASDE
jgi:hypothetical protein